MRGTGQSLDLQLHQAVCGKADHLPQKIAIGALLKHRTKRHHIVGHRGHPRLRFCCGDQTLPKARDDRLGRRG
jgi:hypothetical protein